LSRHRSVGLDTSVFIFEVEAHPKYIELTHSIFQWLKSPAGMGVTSTITMLEILVHPYRDSDDDLVDNFYALLSTYPHLTWAETTLEIADNAARLRAKHGLRTPDAIQAATAMAHAATGFISNDPIFRRVPDFETLILDDLLASKL
jgi:predicted nucleic acid-binding protein